MEKRKTFSKQTRLNVYKKFNGHCAYCGKAIELKDMQVDHIQAIRRGGSNEEDNLFPSCRACNYYKSTLKIESFRKELKKLPSRLEKVFIFRMAVAYGLIEVRKKPISFFFEDPN